MTRRLLCAGEVVVDLVLRVPGLPRRGGDLVADSVSAEPGGAMNVMAAARRQGVPVTYAGLLGTGPMASLAAAALHAEGIQTVLPPRSDRDTATIVTLVEPDGERSFVTTLGAEADLTGGDLESVTVRDDDIVYVSGYGLAYPRNGPSLARWVPGLPDAVTVVLDLSPLVADIPPGVLAPVLARTDWVTGSLDEGRAVIGGSAAATAATVATALRDRVRQVAVVRRGSDGATVSTSGRGAHQIEPFAVTPIDVNGAGDAHTGSLIASLAYAEADVAMTDDETLVAVRRANAAAAIAITRHGPATAPTTDELAALLGTNGVSRPTNG